MKKLAKIRGKKQHRPGRAVATNNFTTLGSRLHKNKFLIYIKKLLGCQSASNKMKKKVNKNWNQNKNRKEEFLFFGVEVATYIKSSNICIFCVFGFCLNLFAHVSKHTKWICMFSRQGHSQLWLSFSFHQTININTRHIVLTEDVLENHSTTFCQPDWWFQFI